MKYFIILFIFLGFLNACATIPPEAPDLSIKVGTGIEVLQENALDLVKAWEIVALKIVNSQWDSIYEKADEMYREKRSVSNPNLTPEQVKEIAALAAIIQGRLTDKVREKATEMQSIIIKNGSTIREMNNKLTDLLSSARGLIEANEALLDTVTNLTPIPMDLFRVTQ
jgi:uncharacterized protein YjaG (DUF416 family)